MRDLLGPGADVLVDLQPGAAGAQAVLDRLRRAEDARTSSAALTGSASSAAQVAAQALGGVAAEVPDRAVVLDHQRRQAAGERRVATCGESQCTCGSTPPGVTIMPRRVEHRGRGVEHDVDAVHRVRVAGAADGDDAAVRDADARPRDAEHGVEQQPADDRELDAAALGAHAEAVAHRAAEAGQDRRSALVALGLDHEPAVAERDAGLRHRGSPARARSCERLLARARRVERAVDEPAVAAHHARPPNGRPYSRRGSPGSKKTFAPAASASRMPQAAARSKLSARLSLEEVEVRGDADGDLALVARGERAQRPSRHSSGGSGGSAGGASRADRVVQHDQPLPSANSASTSMRGTSSATPSSTSSGPSAR